MLDSGASHLFVTESMVKSHKWLAAITEVMSIHLATGIQAVLDSMCTIPKVFCDTGRQAITQHITCLLVKNLSYDIILGMDWLKTTNPVIDCVACPLELTVGDNMYIVLALPVNSIAYVTLSSLK